MILIGKCKYSIKAKTEMFLKPHTRERKGVFSWDTNSERLRVCWDGILFKMYYHKQWIEIIWAIKAEQKTDNIYEDRNETLRRTNEAEYNDPNNT